MQEPTATEKAYAAIDRLFDQVVEEEITRDGALELALRVLQTHKRAVISEWREGEGRYCFETKSVVNLC